MVSFSSQHLLYPDEFHLDVDVQVHCLIILYKEHCMYMKIVQHTNKKAMDLHVDSSWNKVKLRYK